MNPGGSLKSLISKIDAALGSIYEIDIKHNATEYISDHTSIKQPGALLIRTPSYENADIEVAIAFSAKVQSTLRTLNLDGFFSWSHEQIQAFSVAAEEISHFRYFVFHAEKDRQVSQLELEFHGEIDKFLMFHLMLKDFESVYSKLFESFSLSDQLTPLEQERYHSANQLAREFIVKNRLQFNSTESFADFLKNLRALYRMSPQEKFSLKHRL
ncbi:MAG: hypothetical protein EBQ92_04170 [Proteobacteria bacterium]|nr:hypothetical protein [Pseudomonadota bacterium]